MQWVGLSRHRRWLYRVSVWHKNVNYLPDLNAGMNVRKGMFVWNMNTILFSVCRASEANNKKN